MRSVMSPCRVAMMSSMVAPVSMASMVTSVLPPAVPARSSLQVLWRLDHLTFGGLNVVFALFNGRSRGEGEARTRQAKEGCQLHLRLCVMLS